MAQLRNRMVDPAKNATSASEDLRLRTPRLELIAATLPLIESEVCSPAKLSSLLQAEVGTWPPPLNDESSLGWTHEKLKENPDGAGFFVWYVVSNEHQSRKLVGIVAFKGPPDAEGTIEAGYSILEKHQKRGIGTEATRAIMQWAFRSPAVRQINAETFPELRPSIRVMERCGMTFRGEGSEVGTIRYGVTREEFERREAG
jgi:ribosomal-protein-alanine N-acetyltransferase